MCVSLYEEIGNIIKKQRATYLKKEQLVKSKVQLRSQWGHDALSLINMLSGYIPQLFHNFQKHV